MDEHLKILLCEENLTQGAIATPLAGQRPDWRIDTGSLAQLTEQARRQPYDCILLHNGPPGSNSLHALRSLRGAGVHTPVIILTTQADEQLAAELIQAGASDYLVIPADIDGSGAIERLPHAIERAVRAHHTRQHDRQATERLRENEDRFRLMADTAPVMIWMSGPDGRPFYFNESWLQYTGRTLDEAIATGWETSMHPDDIERCIATFQENIRKRQPFTTEHRLRRHDGVYRWFVDSGSPRYGRDGSFLGYVGSSVDITERIEVEQQRKQLLVRERAARAEAEAAQRRLSFLAEASTVLSESLDYTTTLKAVAQLAVPWIADWCAIHMASPDGQIELLAASHVDPKGTELAYEAHKRFPPDPNAEQGLAAVLRTGKPELYRQITDEMLVQTARGPEHLKLLREIGMSSAMIVPLPARGRNLGTITLISSQPTYRFGAADLSLVEDLARRAAAAVDNALLYREAQEALQSKDRAMTLLDTLLATAPIGFALFNRELRFLRVNQAMVSINGVSAEQSVGRTLTEVLPDIGRRVEGYLRRVLESGQPTLNVEISGQTPSAPGQIREWMASYYPVRSRDGELLGVGTVVMEITDRKRNQEIRASCHLVICPSCHSNSRHERSCNPSPNSQDRRLRHRWRHGGNLCGHRFGAGWGADDPRA